MERFGVRGSTARVWLLICTVLAALTGCGAGMPGFATGPGGAFARSDEVLTEPGELPVLHVASDAKSVFPLTHTSVDATLAGFAADVEVRQAFENPYDRVIEAEYVFPLPENAAVYAMSMTIGDRVIEAVVQDRRQAWATYVRAREEGRSAALLQQERPNIFSQRVANIAPGSRIEVVIRYAQDLTYDAGEYEFVFPMVVGPRYIPGAPIAGGALGDPRDGTREVPDAARITPPVMGKGTRTGHDIALTVTASTEGLVSSIEVPTHPVERSTLSDGRVRVSLADKDEIPNRDFVMRYRVAGEKPQSVLYKTPGEDGYFSMVIQPPSLDISSIVGRRELVFVVDVSGSMAGAPLSLCKTAMRDALFRMRPVDTFNVVTFAGSTGKAFAAPRPANARTIADALSFVDRLMAGGGTEMLNAVDVALAPDGDKTRNRYVFFLTDGFVGNEEAILERTGQFVGALREKGQKARVFGFGVGSSPNRMLIEGLGREGDGLSVYATNREDPARAVTQFYRYIDRSVLRSVRADFGSGDVRDVYPAELPDLFASRPIVVHGQFRGGLRGPVIVKGEGPNGEVEIPVVIARAPQQGHTGLQDLLWARAKLTDLEQDLWDGAQRSEAEARITELGIRHHLVTPFTSFVAVDRTRTVGDGSPRHVDQPVEAPEDVDPEAAGARTIEVGDPYGYEFSDDPLAAGGFGPNDAQIRVRPQAGSAQIQRATASQQVYAVQQIVGPRGCYCSAPGAGAETRDRRSRWPVWLGIAALGWGVISRRTRGPRRKSTSCRKAPFPGPGTSHNR